MGNVDRRLGIQPHRAQGVLKGVGVQNTTARFNGLRPLYGVSNVLGRRGSLWSVASNRSLKGIKVRKKIHENSMPENHKAKGVRLRIGLVGSRIASIHFESEIPAHQSVTILTKVGEGWIEMAHLLLFTDTGGDAMQHHIGSEAATFADKLIRERSGTVVKTQVRMEDFMDKWS